MTVGESNSRITIAHLLPWPTLGGVEIATIRLVSATSDRFRHVAFCIRGSSDLIAAFRQAGAEIVEYTPPEPSLRHGLRFFNESRAVAKELRRCGAQIAHASETKASYHNSLATVLAGVPLITHVRSRYSVVPFRERLTLLPTRRYVFVSKDSWHHFAVKVPPSKGRVLYDAVAVPEPKAKQPCVRQEFAIPERAPLIGMVARVAPVKDYFTLADAAAKVLAKRPDARFLIVGDNSQVEFNRKHYGEVVARLRELGIAGSFQFTGHREDVPRFVAALDVFVLCTHREGLPLSILEAMAMGKPVIATSVGGIPEVVTDGVTGLLHTHGDSMGLADAILQCIEDPGKAAALGMAGQERVRSEHSTLAYTLHVTQIYEELLG